MISTGGYCELDPACKQPCYTSKDNQMEFSLEVHAHVIGRDERVTCRLGKYMHFPSRK